MSKKSLRRGVNSPQHNDRTIRKIEIELNKIDDLEQAVNALNSASSIIKADSILSLSQTIDEDVVIEEGRNGLSLGPVTISEGRSVTVSEDSVWTVL